MGKIRKLDKYLIPKIAAGEVVDRPASVIKELIDNSLDAHAAKIEIELINAGKDLIKIIDDGEGMDKEDLEKCFQPFTTSKIYKEEDLNNINTFGFRGEALSSVSSVAKVIIKSRQKDSIEGYELYIEEGKRKRIKPVGIAEGTIIQIEDLFFNIPARKKFLKTDQTELHHIISLIEKYAISNWNKSFKVTHNKRIMLDIPKSNNLLERLSDIYGAQIAKGVIEINQTNEYLNIKGYVGTPNNSFYTSDKNCFFVNNRYVENKQINYAIRNAYGKLLENRAFPFYILFLELMPNLVNINIHPQKKEVRFWNDKDVAEFILRSVQEELNKNAVTYDTDYFGNDLKKASLYQFNKLKENTKGWNIKGIEEKEEYEDIFQLDRTYIVTKSKEGLVLIDQHAAHESILYEQYLEGFETNKKDSNKNLVDTNEIIEVSNTVKYSIESNIDILINSGFEIEFFGNNSFKVSKLPEIFKDHNVQKLIEELLANIENVKHIDEKSKQTIEFLACRGAIKAGELLTKDEMINLAKKLDQSKGYLTCPHGRPTKVTIPMRDMGKIFKRI